MTRFEKFAYPAIAIALLVAWIGLTQGNETLRTKAPAAQLAGGAR